jgi:hypothetical protein
VKEIFEELDNVEQLMGELKMMQDLTLDCYNPENKKECEGILKELVKIQGEFLDIEKELNDMLKEEM